MLPRENLSDTMPFVSLPLANIQVLIVVVTVALTFSETLSPISMVLVICAFLLVAAVKNAMTVSDVSPFSQNFTLVMVAIAISVLRMDALRDARVMQVTLPINRSCCGVLVPIVEAAVTRTHFVFVKAHVIDCASLPRVREAGTSPRHLRTVTLRQRLSCKLVVVSDAKIAHYKPTNLMNNCRILQKFFF